MRKTKDIFVVEQEFEVCREEEMRGSPQYFCSLTTQKYDGSLFQ